MEHNATDPTGVNHMVETERRLTSLETSVRYVSQRVDGIDKKLDALTDHLLKTETGTRSNRADNTLYTVVHDIVITLIAALVALVGVKLGGKI